MYQHQPFDELVRRSLLYFDEMLLPTADIISMDDNMQGFDYLMREGVLSLAELKLAHKVSAGMIERFRLFGRREGFVIGGPILADVAAFHVKAFLERERQQPGMWAFATVGEGLDIPQHLTVQHRAVEMELYNCLPVPGFGVPYGRILEFKHSQKDTLDELRGRMDESYEIITRSGDMPHSKITELRKLETALGDVQKALKQSRVDMVLESMKIDVSLGQIVGGIGAGAVAGQFYGVPQSIAIPLAGALALIKFDVKQLMSPTDRVGPLKYIYQASKESIIS